ncbi:hypothetical protein HK100_003954 [Physocladia obscura]|uniref:Uncharacterized protein n=1 Tax=Physocladia obscura TaxID=109957 RepID=A0AAD5T7F3_9FUNG|nr:hypothetical protein HK100_003954 [Physocladia obscura]
MDIDQNKDNIPENYDDQICDFFKDDADELLKFGDEAGTFRSIVAETTKMTGFGSNSHRIHYKTTTKATRKHMDTPIAYTNEQELPHLIKAEKCSSRSYLTDSDQQPTTITIPIPKDGTFDELNYPQISAASLKRVKEAIAEGKKSGRMPKCIVVKREEIRRTSSRKGEISGDRMSSCLLPMDIINQGAKTITIPISKDGHFPESGYPEICTTSWKSVQDMLNQGKKERKIPKSVAVKRERVKKGSREGGVVKK